MNKFLHCALVIFMMFLKASTGILGYRLVSYRHICQAFIIRGLAWQSFYDVEMIAAVKS